MIKRAITIACTLLLGVGTMQAQKAKHVEVGLGYSSTSVNTSIFRGNSLVTFGDQQYISYYDSTGTVILGKRTIGSTEWQLVQTPYKGNVADAHNDISIMVDGEGYLHMSYNQHGRPLCYYKSVAPGSLELGNPEQMIGEDEKFVTYPEFYRMPNGDLIFAYRSGISGRGDLILNKYTLADHKWTRLSTVIDGQNKRNAYWQICVDKQGTIHISWVWRETFMVETNHDMCYARSRDGGLTWEKSNGKKYTLPITADNAEYAWKILQKSELINQTSMTTDDEGHPYIATYWRDLQNDIPQYRLIYHNGRKWKTVQVSNRQTPFSLSGGGTKMIPIARPKIVAKNGSIYYIFRDEERGSKVSMTYTHNLASEKWTTIDLTDFNVDAWEPTYDTELWKEQGKLHIFVQPTSQGDGEKVKKTEPKMVEVLEVDL